MSGKRDLLIGFASGYTYDKIALWVNSICDSGFSGVKILGSYDLLSDTKRYAIDHGFDVVELGPVRRSVLVDRFDDLSKILENANFGRVITADVGDLVFMSNPSDRLDELMVDCSILASPEYLRYCDQDWNNENMRQTFGENVAGIMFNRMVCNAGIIAGEQESVRNIAKEIHYLCMQSHSLQHGSDQSAYNILLASYGDEVKYATTDEAWAAQLHVHFHPESSRNLQAQYRVGSDGIVRNEKRKEFCIVHQYNRNQSLTNAIRKKFL
jgi:hypothetical protein